jgi:hypothetical protein
MPKIRALKLLATVEQKHILTEEAVTVPNIPFWVKKIPCKRLNFTEMVKYGIVTDKSVVVLPPQYFKLSKEIIDNGNFISFSEYEKKTLLRTGFLNRQGKPLLDKRFKTVRYSYCEGIFFICLNPYPFAYRTTTHQGLLKDDHINAGTLEKPNNEVFGLGKADGTVFFEPQFSSIKHITYTSLFAVELPKSGNKPIFDDRFAISRYTGYEQPAYYDGLFSTYSKKWIVDTTAGILIKVSFESYPNFIVKDSISKKYGLIDTTGAYILPISLDSFGIVDKDKGIFWIKKDRKYQLVTTKKGKTHIHKAKYDFLEAINFTLYTTDKSDIITYFLVKNHNKWGVMDANGKIVKPVHYDDALISNYQKNHFILVKNNQADYFTLESFPNATFRLPHYETADTTHNKLLGYLSVDNTKRSLFLNDTGKVMIPPQYQERKRSYRSDYVLLENEQKHKKAVFLKTGKTIDIPFDHNIAWLDTLSHLVLVKDSTDTFYGVTTTDGKQLVPCINYGVAIGDIKSSVFFVKQDTPLVQRHYDIFLSSFNSGSIGEDTLSLEDQNWLMYDGSGKLLSKEPFRFPIDFKEGIGIGMKGETFNLYKTDGSIFEPFSRNTEGDKNKLKDIWVSANGYKNIRRDDKLGFYTLFFNQGLTPTLILTKANGEILVSNGRYDGISEFYDKYALITAAGKVGLIDTLGREIIAPQDLRTYQNQFVDSLDLRNALNHQLMKKGWDSHDLKWIQLPIHFEFKQKKYHPDSFKLTTAQRSALWNLLLEQTLATTIQTVNDLAIPRTKTIATASFFSKGYSFKEYHNIRPLRITVADSTIAFTMFKQLNMYSSQKQFYNFYRYNNRWEALQINDLLMIQGEKRWIVNDLITKKVKALKDVQIDCSNTSAFVTTVENRFMLTKEGVDFCFDSTEHGNDFVVISFTWAELSPFLKLRIY